MPDLTDLRRDLLAARAENARATRAHLVEEQRLRALRQEASAIARRLDQRNQQAASARRRSSR